MRCLRQISLAVAMLSLIVAIAGTPAAADPYDVPKGGLQEQAAFLESLLNQQPPDAASAAKMREAALKSADKILAGKPNAAQLALAVKVKGALEKDPEELAALEAKLTKQGHKDAARSIHGRLLLIQLAASLSAGPEAFKKQQDAVQAFLAKGPPTDGDAELAAAAKQMEAKARRLNLVGNTIQLEGKQLDGAPLKWSKYRGKVVLIDFWATWCGPCMAEMPNIKQNYEKYHEKGFDVVGISLDQMPAQQLADFVKKEGVAWTICRDADSPTRMAERFDVEGIPTLILVGRDGKVVSLNARGPALAPLVEKALAAEGGAAIAADDATDDSANADNTGRKKNRKGEKAGAKAAADDRAEKKQEKEKERAEALAAAKAKRDELAKSRAPKPREWTDSSGNFHKTATFRGMANGTVKLLLDDGSVINVPLEKLSDEDQKYIEQRSE